jgi:hypothetical protein
MSSLTEFVTSPQSERMPLMLEVPVAPGLDGPFLVSSTGDLIWVARTFSNGRLRVAVRTVPIPFMFRDAIHKVFRMSMEKGWGSWAPPSAEGVASAISHLSEYGLEEVEVLYGKDFNEKLLPEKVPAREAHWVPANWAVVLPVDRAFVGTTFDFGAGRTALVLHNASRAVGVVAPAPTFLADSDLPQRLLNALERGLKGKPQVYVEDLALYTAEELLAVKGVGKSSLKTIEDCLASKGVHLYGRNA